jgi:plastocyanin
MNKLFSTFVFLLSVSFLSAQTQQIDLSQSPGVFNQENVSLEAGQYQFNISNTDVDGQVGFVLVPKGKYDASMHIKEAYVTAPVETGKTSKTNVVNLAAGEYEYFCPLNNTPKYSLTVHDKVENVELKQMPGAFSQKTLTLKEGAYKFNIANAGVGHDVGFVLVPAGKYDATDHIKAAYVTAPVPTGETGMTGIVDLKAGEYEYFCPLNPTPKYRLTVK